MVDDTLGASPTEVHPDGAPSTELSRRLDALESEHDVRIVYACESGSRAWGFPSIDSDYDVRFLYVRPRDWYLSIDVEKRRDVIETPLDGVWDIGGWDIRKALQLFKKSNTPLVEWLGSPMVYRERPPAPSLLRGLLPRFFNPMATWFHYLHLAKGTHRDFLAGEQVKVKKIFYALRPLLACRWIERGQGAPPTALDDLMQGTLDDDDEALRAAIGALRRRKRQGQELGESARVPVLSDFIDEELQRLQATTISKPERDADPEELSVAFRTLLDHTAA